MDAANLRHTNITVSHPAPDKSVAAWLKVLGCFLVFINTYGVAATYGAYQAYYQTNFLATSSPSKISWIGTVQVFLLGLAGVVAGPFFDRGYSRSVLSFGCFLIVLGHLTLSFSYSYASILLSQGVCIGTGQGLTYVPAVAAVANAFTNLRPIALGIGASGAAVGGVILPITFRSLVSRIGFDWLNRVFALFTLVTSASAVILLWPKSPIPPRRGFLDLSAFKEPPYIFLCIGLFLVELGYWIPPFTIPVYAELKMRTGTEFAFDLLAMMNAGSFAGRILPAFVAQSRRIGPAWTLVVGAFSLGTLILCWIGIQSRTGIMVWGVLVGFMSGITVSLPNAVLPRLSPAHVVGARSGMMWCIVSFAALIGAPIAGILVNTETNDYKRAQMFSGISICLGACALCVPAWHIGRKRNV